MRGVMAAEAAQPFAGVALFIACPAFAGAKAGYVFKMGSEGLGYYIDAAPALPAEASREVYRDASDQKDQPAQPHSEPKAHHHSKEQQPLSLRSPPQSMDQAIAALRPLFLKASIAAAEAESDVASDDEEDFGCTYDVD